MRPALVEELGASQPEIFKKLERSIPNMFDKTERFAPELREIAGFISEEWAGSESYGRIAALGEILTEPAPG